MSKLFERLTQFGKPATPKIAQASRDAAVLQQQSAQTGLAIVTNSSNPTAYSPDNLGLSVAKFGQTLPMAGKIRLTVTSEGASAAGNALLLGSANILTLAGVTASSSITVTAGNGNGTATEYTALQAKLCNYTYVFSNVQVRTAPSASAATTSANNYKDALYLDITKVSDNLAGKRGSQTINVDESLNELASNPNAFVTRPELTLDEGTLGPDSAMYVQSFPINTVAKYTFYIVASAVGQIYS